MLVSFRRPTFGSVYFDIYTLFIQIWSLPRNDSMSNECSNKFDLFTSLRSTTNRHRISQMVLHWLQRYAAHSLSLLITRLSLFPSNIKFAGISCCLLLETSCYIRMCVHTSIWWIELTHLYECFWFRCSKTECSSGEKWRTTYSQATLT